MADSVSDLDKARTIVASHTCFAGPTGAHRENIAIAVAEGIALGRKEGFVIAAGLFDDALKRVKW